MRYSLQSRHFCLTPLHLEKLNSNCKRYAGWLKEISQVFVLKRSVVWFRVAFRERRTLLSNEPIFKVFLVIYSAL